MKRGLINTSDPGGFYKDKAYLEGAVRILELRRIIDFKDLYCGKLDVDDILDETKKVRPHKEGIKLPLFLEDMNDYMTSLGRIANCNFID